MSLRGRVVGAVAGGLGLAAAGTAYGVAHQNKVISARVATGPDEPAEVGGPHGFGSLRAPATTVVADDGLPLHTEVDEVAEALAQDRGRVAGRRRRRSQVVEQQPTVVFVHGYCLQLDCWHFQRAAYRGRVRTVFYDQRSHGRSGRSSRERSTIDQLGHDLRAVLDTVAPDGPVVLVGHSMGGMGIIALAEHYPELIGDRVVGVALISTTAGGIDPGKILLPLVPTRLSSELTGTAVATLRPLHRSVDALRRMGNAVAKVGTDVFAFGGKVPASYVAFADAMLSATPFEVVGDFFPSFRSLDKFDSVEVLGRIPVAIVCGTKDKLTSVGHSRKLHARIPGSTLTEIDGAGHLVLLESHDQVTAEIDRLLARTVERLAS